MAVIVPWLPVSGLAQGTGCLPHSEKLSAETMLLIADWSEILPLSASALYGVLMEPVTVDLSGTALSRLKPPMAHPPSTKKTVVISAKRESAD